MKDFGWKVGGKQGEGIDSTGDIFSIALHRMGYFAFTYRHFMSLIKGGHTNYKIRISDRVLRHHGDTVSVLIAFDQTTIDVNWHEMVDGGVVISDSTAFEATAPDDRNVHLYGIPLTDIAKEAGSSIMKNMVAIGISSAIAKLDPEDFAPVVADKFKKKGQSVIDNNMAALRAGYRYYLEHHDVVIPAPAHPQKSGEHLYLSGNQATGFGALAGGCRLLAAYPITPATEVMYWVISQFPKYGGLVLQAEDEIAAVNMAIGANFAGVRAMTSTSGPGFSLMMEALGLSGISETPLVIVDVMRSGPSTGLPTKTEQSDLNEAVHGTHGDIERIVLTPRTVEESFYYTAEAFNLAAKYQCPVIVLTDLYTGMSSQSVDNLPIDKVTLDRGKLVSDEELAQLERFSYQRYDTSPVDGISPRALPGQHNARYVALGNEHNGVGLEVEDQETRLAQVNKRRNKLANFTHESGVTVDGQDDADFALVGFGSTWGILEEAREALEEHGVVVKHIHFSRVAPFPTEQLEAALSGVSQALVAELNSSGQLVELMKKHVACHDKLVGCLKYDGDPFSLHDILARVQEVKSVEVLS